MSLTKIDLGISIGGHGPNKKDQKYIHITRSDVIQRINKHPAIDPWTREYLTKRVNEYPDSALTFFVQNINQIVVTAINERNRVLKEQHEENRKKLAESQAHQPSKQQPSSGERREGVGEAGSKENVSKTEKKAPVESEKERENLFSRSTR